MISDNPIEGAIEDLLGREGVAESIADNIRFVDASKGYVVGVLGPWGSGKTSLVNLVRERFKDAQAIPVLDFNPWMFSGTEQLVESFFAEVAAQLRLKGGKFDGIANGLDAYSELLTPLTLLPFVGAWFDRFRGVTRSIKGFQEKRKEGVTARRARLAAELGKLDVPILIVIDDIDRLTTTEIREMFKLVRLTASFPNIIYLLAFDRARVERDAEAILSVAADPAALKTAFAAIDPDRLEDVVAALEAYEGAFPAGSIAPLTAALFAILPTIPDRERPFMSFSDPRLVVTGVALRALRQLASPEEVDAVVTQALEQTSSLSAKLALIQMVGHTDGAGHKLVGKDVAAAYEASLRDDVAAATAEQLSSETDLLMVLVAAAASGLDVPEHLATVVTPELTRAIVLDSVSETRSRPMGNRAVTRRPRLAWDLLLEVFGSPEALINAIDAARGLAEDDQDYAAVLKLADRYAAGWRPPDFSGDEDEADQTV